MSNNVSAYLAAIPATDALYPLAQTVASKITAAANTANVPGANAARQDLPSLLLQFVNSAIDRRKVSPATILSLMAAAATGAGHIVPDTGILGSVTVSGSAITISAGAY